MYKVKIEPLRVNNTRVGDQSGLWRVAVYDIGEGSVIEEKFKHYQAEGVTYDEAKQIANDLDRRFREG